jgi:nitrate reductase NapE component
MFDKTTFTDDEHEIVSRRVRTIIVFVVLLIVAVALISVAVIVANGFRGLAGDGI